MMLYYSNAMNIQVQSTYHAKGENNRIETELPVHTAAEVELDLSVPRPKGSSQEVAALPFDHALCGMRDRRDCSSA
jgi:hypothetical protein